MDPIKRKTRGRMILTLVQGQQILNILWYVKPNLNESFLSAINIYFLLNTALFRITDTLIFNAMSA